jgi:predicted HTH transcriptional regulator
MKARRELIFAPCFLLPTEVNAKKNTEKINKKGNIAQKIRPNIAFHVISRIVSNTTSTNVFSAVV